MLAKWGTFAKGGDEMRKFILFMAVVAVTVSGSVNSFSFDLPPFWDPRLPKRELPSQKLMMSPAKFKEMLEMLDWWAKEAALHCAPFYTFIPKPAQGSICGWMTMPGAGSEGGKKIVGGYECKFSKTSFVTWLDKNGANCPAGSELNSCGDESYHCVSSSPIAQEAIKCPEGYKVDHTWTGKKSSKYEEMCDISNGQTVGKSWCFGYECVVKVQSDDNSFAPGTNTKVCADSGAFLAGGGCSENCCVYLGEE